MKLHIFLFLVVLASACTPKQNDISGALNGDLNAYKSYLYIVDPQSFENVVSTYTGAIVDSIEIDSKGNFGHNLNPELKGRLLYMVVQKKEQRFNKNLVTAVPSLANFYPFVFNSNTIEITGDIESLGLVKASSTDSDNKSLEKTIHTWQKAYNNHLAKYTAESHGDLMVFENDVKKYKQELINFADTTTSVYASILASRLVSVDGDYERNYEFLVGLCNRWESDNDNYLLKGLCDLANSENRPIIIGEKVPDFNLPLMNGNEANLYSLFGSKYTVIDLWASWCAPCRKESRETLVPLYDKYSDQGLQIVGYALDADKGSWIKAIRRDDVGKWPQASHLQGDDAPFLDKMNISTIPANLIVDDKGTVIAKDVHGAKLDTLIQKLFPNS